MLKKRATNGKNDTQAETVGRILGCFRSALTSAPVGLAVTDLNRRVIFLNRQAEALTGYPSEEIAGRPISTYYEDSADFSADEIMAARDGHTVTREMDLLRKDGVVVPVIVDCTFASALAGEGPYYIEAYLDQTDRKRLDHLKNEFVFIAAHELRSPVSAINLLLNLIFEDRRIHIDPILRDYLTKLHEAEERLLQLVDDLLEVSRTEVGRLKIKVSPQDISEHLEEVFNEFRATALSRDVRLEHDPSIRPPPVMADPNKLNEIITNLVSNAVKYNTPGGTVTVTFHVRADHLYTTVADTGIGISAEEQKRLFTKFWRSEDLAVRSQPGTGLGLFIVKEVTERMGGHVQLNSERGHGTTVTFSLPLAPPDEKPGRVAF
jgi:PAS domain S-box-containing protein